MDQLSGTEVEKSNAVNQLTAPPNTRGARSQFQKDCWKGEVRYESSDSHYQRAGSQ